jgi:hypothetical protein
VKCLLMGEASSSILIHGLTSNFKFWMKIFTIIPTKLNDVFHSKNIKMERTEKLPSFWSRSSVKPKYSISIRISSP